MATSQTVDHALRLLEAIYLLLPIVAILMQSMIRYYSQDSTVPQWRKSKAFLIALAGFVVLAGSGGLVLTILVGSVDTLVLAAAVGSLVGLALFGISLWYLVNDIMRAEDVEQTESTQRLSERADDDRDRDESYAEEVDDG